MENDLEYNRYIDESLENDLRKKIEYLLINGATRGQLKLRNDTPKILIDLGIENLPIVATPSHIIQNILTKSEANKKGLPINKKRHYHGLGKELYVKAIFALDNPIEVFQWKLSKKNLKYDSNNYIVLTRLNKKGRSIIVPLYLKKDVQRNVYEINAGRYSQERTYAVKTIYNKDKIYKYLNDKIKEKSLINLNTKNRIIRGGSLQKKLRSLTILFIIV